MTEPGAIVDPTCAHCGQPAPIGQRFCCAGCDAAFGTIQTLGLGRYYSQRVLDATVRAPRPDAAEVARLLVPQPV